MHTIAEDSGLPVDTKKQQLYVRDQANSRFPHPSHSPPNMRPRDTGFGNWARDRTPMTRNKDATPQPSHLLGPLQAADLTRTPVSRLHRNGGITNGSICGYTYSHKGSDMARSHSFLPRQSFHQQTDSQMPMPHAPVQGRKDRWHTPLHYKHSRL